MGKAVDERVAGALERISKILAGILLSDVRDSDQIQKIARLRECGFQNREIADMLGTTANTVKAAVHSLRSKRKGRKRKAGAPDRRRAS